MGLFCLPVIRKFTARAWACDKSVGNTFERRLRRPRRGEYQDDTSIAGNCQASNKAKDWAFLLYLLFVGELRFEEDKSVGNGFAQHGSAARRVAGRKPGIQLPGIK